MNYIELINELKMYNPYVEIIGNCRFKRNLMKVEYNDKPYYVKELIHDLELLKIKDVITYNDNTFRYHRVIGMCYSDVETHKLTFNLCYDIIN